MDRGSLARKVQLGLLARDMARSRGDSDRATRARRHVVDRLGKLHGLPQKIGQILSLGELEQEEVLWTELTETVPALDAADIFPVIETSLDRPLRELFSSIEDRGIAASLSQVHRARLHDGREVAVKVQYPDIADAIWQDLRALGWLTAPIGGLKRGFNLHAYQDEVRRIVTEELDYGREAATLRRFHALTVSSPDVETPVPIDTHSTENVLTMTWLDGVPFNETRTWPGRDRDALAESLLRLFLRSCFQWRVLHGDPHPGNLRFGHGSTGRPVIKLFDFGCVQYLDDALVEAVHALIAHTANGTLRDAPEELLSYYTAAGFDPDLLAPMQSRLPELTELLFEPFRHDRPYPLDEWNMRDRVDRLLGADRWNFRFAGPPHLIVFIRAYQGLLQYLKALGRPVNWQRPFREATGAMRLQPARGHEAEPIGIDPIADTFRVAVEKNGVRTVQVTFRARVAPNIENLMSDEILESLKRRAISIESLKEKMRASNYAPGELFRLEENGKSIRVWLE